MKNRLLVSAVLAVVCAWLLPGCASVGEAPRTLRIGYTPNDAPVTFEIDGEFAGIEADMAHDLAAALHCEPEFVEYEWAKLIPALQAGDIDIIMSGMTITPSRRTQVDFCQSYMDNPLVAVVRAGEVDAYASADDILSAPVTIGALKGTSGEIFAKRHCLRARVVAATFRKDVASLLTSQRFKLYIDDLSAGVEILQQNEAALSMLPFALHSQQLAWAVAPGNGDLRDAANAVLARWQASGRLDAVLDRWLPYRAAFVRSAQ